MKYADKYRGLTLSRLKTLLHYDPLTGTMTNLTSRSDKARAGTIAGTIKGPYRVICIDHKLYMAHRLAWFYHYGQWPSEQIDHKDKNGLNNKIDNLRLATRRLNSYNTKKPQRVLPNGLPKGVYPYKGKKFGAKIIISAKVIYLGTYKTPLEAGEAYKQASLKYHGQFSPFRV